VTKVGGLSTRRPVVGGGFALAVAAAVAAAALLAAPSGGAARGAARPAASTAGPSRLDATLAADVAVVRRAEASARALAGAPGMPTCAPPALPAPTYPPGGTYGVPFLAAITGGQILAGYDEWTANHHLYTWKGRTYKLYPWQAKVYDISGWVTGLLRLPSLSATITPQDLVFCDQGGQSCVSASPPVGQCIHFLLRGAPVNGPPSQPVTNIPAPGTQCFQQTPGCIPYVITLNPAGDSQLTVTGVEPDGALMLSVTTSASTTLNITLPTTSETCSSGQTSITLSSQRPSSLPAGSPITPTPGNPDFRSIRAHPLPLTGPLGTATTTLASNDFYVPAFSPAACPLLAEVFDSPLAGWNTLPPKDPATETNNYFDKSPLPADAGVPGWDQFSATTTISDLGLPVGPPSGFTLSPPAP
jgi:hypothetical protein